MAESKKPILSTEEVLNRGPWRASEAHSVASGKDFEYHTCDNDFSLFLIPEAPLIFLNPRPKKETLSIIYPLEYAPFHFHELRGMVKFAREFVQKRKAKAIMKLAGPEGDILDAGCGSAAVLRMIAKLRGGTKGLYANDFDDSILVPLKNLGFTTIVGELNSFETPHRFNVISLNQVIEHVPDPWAVLRNLDSHLKEGGFLFIETPSIDALDRKLFRRRYWGGYHIPRHFFIFNCDSLTRSLHEAGFDTVSVQYIANPVFWTQSLHHFFYDKGYRRLAAFWTHKNFVAMALFTLIDTVILAVYGKTSNMRVIARKRTL